ncbi:histidine phosphatase family protein [Brevibacterium samyangense]|uniref:Histidine phosphatase family protein n=1 Tax=Brevibacterium samyangense TaxID=366888 RepID=A0ABP5ERK5_9MICO
MSNFLGRALGDALLTKGEGYTDVWLVRHGQQIRASHDSPEFLAYDAPLSETGRAQAEATADLLADADLHAVYSSDLARANDTGKAIASRHGLDVTIVPEVREVGIFRDVPQESSFEAAVGGEAAAAAASAMVRTVTWDAIPLGEGSAEFRARVHSAIWAIARAHPGENVVVACHGGVVNGFLAEEYGLARDFLFRPAHAGVTRVRFSHEAHGEAANRAVLLTANEIAHLEAQDLLTF